jgi:hypothetical protein
MSDATVISDALIFVTGADRSMFFQLFPLLESLRRNSPATTLHVCDFGLTAAQARFLRAKGSLLERPDDARLPPHPWYDKARLAEYVAPLGDRPVVWMDADLIILDDFPAALRGLNAQMAEQGCVLAAASTGSIGDSLEGSAGPHFRALMAGADVSFPYFQNGLFLCRSAAFLRHWAQLCAAMPMELLFEQNAFNHAAMSLGDSTTVLNHLVWNLAAHAVDDTGVAVSGETLTIATPAGRAHVLHLTSIDRARDLCAMQLRLSIGGVDIHPTVRMMNHPKHLLDFQVALTAAAFAAEFPALEAAGVIAEHRRERAEQAAVG